MGPSVNIFCNNKRLPADPEMRTEIVKPVIKVVVHRKLHLLAYLLTNIGIFLKNKAKYE